MTSERTLRPRQRRAADNVARDSGGTTSSDEDEWNKEVIAEFYATIYFGYIEDERAIFWMTKGSYYKAKFTQFIWVLGLDRDDANRPKIHLQPVFPMGK